MRPSHAARADRRRPVAENHVPTSSPANAAPAFAAEVSRVGMPVVAAMPAASTLVTMPPVPTPAEPGTRTSTPARSSSEVTSGMRRASGFEGWPV